MASIVAVLQTCWGTSRINPTILALAFPQAVVLWSISSSKGRPGGKTVIQKCLASIIRPTRKPRAIGWHPTSSSSILTISTVAELTLYNTSQVTSPVPLYSIPSPIGATIESWAWHRNGQTLAIASSRQVNLLNWTKDTVIESGPPSMSEIDSSCSRGANSIAAGEEGGSSSGLGKMRSMVAMGCSGFVVTTEQGTWLTPHGGVSSGLSGLMGSGSGGSQSAPILNTTLAELRRSRKQGGALVESRLGAPGEDDEEGDRIGSGEEGIIDLVGKLGTANSHASPLEALLGGLSLDGSGSRNEGGTRNGSGSISSIAAAKLLTLKPSSASSSSSSSSKEQEADKDGSRIISSEITSSIALDSILIPGLLASEYNPQDDSTHIVVGSEFCGTLLCFKCLSSHRAEPDQAQIGKGASSNGKQQQIQEVAKITLPAQFHPRGLAIHKGILICFAGKKEGDGKGPLIRTMNTTSVYTTRLLMFHPSWQQRRQQEEGGKGKKEERVVSTVNGLNADVAAMLDRENVESVLDEVIMHQRGPIELTAMLGSPLNNHHHHQRPSSSPFSSPNRGQVRSHDAAGRGVLAFLKDFRKEMREKMDTIEEVVRENSRRISALERRLSLAHR